MAGADLTGALITRTLPTTWPFSVVALGLSGVAMVRGCRRPSEGPPLPRVTPLSALLGMVYLMHWFVVIPWVTLRMAFLPKRLVWAKTAHLGEQPSPDSYPLGDAVAEVEHDQQPGQSETEGEPELATERS